eukprot:COSAG02_NODE_7925_length_2784_cov_1.614525_1_plen_66_part_00
MNYRYLLVLVEVNSRFTIRYDALQHQSAATGTSTMIILLVLVILCSNVVGFDTGDRFRLALKVPL